jgi:hypothetical protein
MVLAGCGGGGSGGVASAAGGGSLSGQSYKGPTAGASVCAYAIDNAAVSRKGAQVQAQAGSTASVVDGCVVTANDGTFNLVLPANVSGDLMVESTGGTYCSDESVFNGTSCAGAGTPIAMGTAQLRSVVTAAASGTVNVPLTLLTTAAVGSASAGTLHAASFATAYGNVATAFGLTGSTTATSPATGALQTALAALSTYLGGDTTLLGGVVAGIAGGAITSATGSVTAPAEIDCSPLAASDLAYSYMGPPIMMPGPGGIPMMMPGPTYTDQSYGFRSACTNSADGLSSVDTRYTFGAANLLNGAELSGTYKVHSFSGSCGTERSYVDTLSLPMTVQYEGTQAIARSASTDPLKAQQGTATRLRVTLLPSGSAPTTHHHLFCRTQAAAPQTVNFQGLITAVNSPLKDGSLSRLDAASVYTNYED